MARTLAKAAGKATAKAKPQAAGKTSAKAAGKAMAKAKPKAAGKTSAKASIWDRAREEGRKALRALDHLEGKSNKPRRGAGVLQPRGNRDGVANAGDGTNLERSAAKRKKHGGTLRW